MKNNKMYHVKSFFAVLLVFLLVMESISPIPQVIAADKKTAKKEETKLPKDEAVFTGNLAEGFDDEALAAMEADSYAMPWEEEAETSTAQPKKKQAVRAQAEEDVTDRVTKKLKFFINGKEVTSGSQFEVVPGSNFSYEFEWSIDDSPSEGQDRPSLDDNSYFEVTLFTVKGLLIPDQKDQPAVINYNGRNVRIGTWSLTYHDENPKGEDDSGSCVFRMDFSKYAGAFKEIGGYKKGSGKFSSNLTGDETITVGDKTGIITFLPPSANPNLPGVSPAPVGKGWTLSKPPILYKDYDFGKGYKWSTQDPNAALKQIEYRAVYLKELQEYQKRLLEKNEDILNEDGTIKDGEEINIDFLEPSEYNYIIEDTLDVNQEFSYLMNDKKYSKDVPFYFEIPIMAAGTGSFLNARSGGVGNNEYDGNGGDFNEDYISGSKFLKLEKEDAVRATPMSWTVVNVKGQDGQKRQKLIVNIGQLGTTEKEKFTQSNIKNPKFKDTITKYIDSAKENITSLEKGNNSPAVMLKTDTAQLETICAGAGISNEDCETVKAKVEEFNRWYNTYFSDKAFVLQNLTDDAKNAFSELTLYSYLQELENNANYPNLKQKQAYQDWKKAYSALPENQNFYSEKREEYLKSWKDALMRYQMTEAFYGKGQIYGFVMKYASKVKNTSVGVYRNDIRISTGGYHMTRKMRLN